MKLLFVASTDFQGNISKIVRKQAESLIDKGLTIDFFPIYNKGLRGYLKTIFNLKYELKETQYDLIHAHYSFSGFAAALAGAKPLIVSLMGSDVYQSFAGRLLIRIFNRFLWTSVVAKSQELKKITKIKDALIIPNGVDLELFKPLNKNYCRKRLGWDKRQKILLFAANQNRYEKNYRLVAEAHAFLNNPDAKIISLMNITYEEMPIYYNAADVVILSSLWEGSPNVIKEAMACNKPIVSTKVGDIEWLFKDVEGYFIAESNPYEYSIKIKEAFKYIKTNNQTRGRQKVIELGLDSENTATKLVDLYKRVIK